MGKECAGFSLPGRTHHPPPLDVQWQIRVFSGPDWGDVAVVAVVKPRGVAGLHGTAVADAALYQEPLFAQALHASVTGHKFHPVEAIQPTEIQVSHAVVGIGEEQRHDKDKQKSRGEEPEAQGELHGRLREEGPHLCAAAGNGKEAAGRGGEQRAEAKGAQAARGVLCRMLVTSSPNASEKKVMQVQQQVGAAAEMTPLGPPT